MASSLNICHNCFTCWKHFFISICI